ncbi:MAG: Uracil phosphoribosyltransferase [Candidatus Anoxychlamydiales bacterium]|nr:Uracil phosphoribosyltransferase [Candidatus Anoxychlamydiales bacterium]
MNENAIHKIIDEKIVLVTILRAGLPLFNGMHNVFLEAEAGFFAMQRNEETLKASIDYVAPILNDIGYIVLGLGDAGDRSYGMK